LSAVFFFIGTALFAYYTARPDALPEIYRDPGKGDSVFPWFIVSVLPPGVTGLLIAAIFAAGMSTISSSLNSTATIILSDYHSRFSRGASDDRAKLRVLHIATLAVGTLGTAVAIAMISVRNALDAWWSLAGIFGGGMLGLFLLGFLSRRVSSRAALAGVVAGVAIILWMTLSPGWTAIPVQFRNPFHGFLTIVFGTTALLVTGLLATAFFQPPPNSNPKSVA
jgi:SSS family solute:Na+ symporter